MIDPRALLAALADGRPVSGNSLATHFGVTRAAVWKQIEKLRALGAPVIAGSGSGYRIAAPIELLDRDAILAALPQYPREQLQAVDVHWQIDSSNSELLRRAQGGTIDLRACFTELQSAGRGRRGRHWHLPLGGGLAFSLLRPFDSGMTALAGLSLAVGIAVIRALEELGFRGLGLKWPNDLQHAGRKLAGILVELGGDALGPCHAVIGIGLNLRLGAHADVDIDQDWCDLASIGDAPLPNRNLVAARLLAHLIDALDQFERLSFESFVDDYARYDALRGKTIRVPIGSEAFFGEAIGVDHTGALRVRTADREILVDSGEVSVRAMVGSS